MREKPLVAIIAQGGMGAACAKRLTDNGLRVITSLEGRSEASAKRAAQAGMVAASDAEIATADFMLSIVPPNEALPLAKRLAPAMGAANRKSVYVDCNAVAPDTVKDVAKVVEDTGAPFLDAGIIGGPPRAGYNGPVFYYSGPSETGIEALNEYGLIFRKVEGAIGAASALKMSYGGITKGLTAVGSAMMLAATRAGVADALHAELSASQPNLMTYFARSVPDMFGKAYRWVPEMEEIAHFSGDPATEDMYRAIAALYRQLAADHEGEKAAIGELAAFFENTKNK